MADDWSSGWLCKGCGQSLGGPTGLRGYWEPGEPQQILEGRVDKDGPFIRCLHCGGKHYYVVDEEGVTRFQRFTPGTRLFYRLRRKLGLLGPDD